MNPIVKNQTQDCQKAIQLFIRDRNHRNEKAHYDDFSEKGLLRTSLLQEQGYICAYCMQRIDDNPLKTKIEHWKTRDSYKKEAEDCSEKGDLKGQKKANEGTLDYNNLIAVCEGKTFNNDHCDTERGKKNPILTVNPTDKRTIDSIKYLKNGKMYSDDTNIDTDIDKHLNLNLPLLQDNRQKILSDIWIAFEIRCKGKNQQQMEEIKKKIVQSFVSKNEMGQFKPYCGVITFFYKKYFQ
ncbi:MAG: hypothetical protein RL329_1524 [Bacteroidota bacterium]|jgi:hypothetical protein